MPQPSKTPAEPVSKVAPQPSKTQAVDKTAAKDDTAEDKIDELAKLAADELSERTAETEDAETATGPVDDMNFFVEMFIPERGDLLAVLNVGAYGRTMSNNLESRLRPPEILIERDKFELIREREVTDDLIGLDLEESGIEA